MDPLRGASWLERGWSLLFGCAEPVGHDCDMSALVANASLANLDDLKTRCPEGALAAGGSQGFLVTGEVEPTACRKFHAFK